MVRVLPAAVLAPLLLGSITFAQQPLLLTFSIPGCGPCRQMAPSVERLRQEGFPVRKVNGATEPQIAQRFGVDRYPTTVLMSGGREVQRASGPQSYQTLRQMLVSVGARPATQQNALVRPAGQRSRVAPATFASAAQPPAAYQVGGDFGPAPEVTIPGANPPRPVETPAPSARTAGAGPDAAGLLSVSVRLKVQDKSGSSFGTGTIIDARSGEALVLTCGHLFRDAEGGPSPRVMVELFQAVGSGVQVVERVPGQVISFDLERDVALVSIRPRGDARVARVASSPGSVSVGASVWSVGCDRGADPTVRVGRVTTVERYHSPPSLTASGAPVVGRSGGGLFNDRGEVVGVCFGADASADEGFYARLTSIHAELDKLGLSEIYGGRPTTPEVAATPRQAPDAVAPASQAMVPVTPRPASPANYNAPASPPVFRGQDLAATRTPNLANLSATERAALEELARRAAESEVVCVIRPKQSGGKSEVLTLERVSPEFLQALHAMRGDARR